MPNKNFFLYASLDREDMRNSFNFLLIALICMDSGFIVFFVLDCFRKDFGLASDAHLVIFPYFLYPCISISMTCSVFMTVGIALERSDT